MGDDGYDGEYERENQATGAAEDQKIVVEMRLAGESSRLANETGRTPARRAV